MPYSCYYCFSSKQTELYDEVFRDVVDSVLRGFNRTIMAYGQTGSGKTFTMQGKWYLMCLSLSVLFCLSLVKEFLSIFDYFWIKHFISLCTPKVSTVLNFSLVVYDVKLHYCNMYHGLFMVALVKTFAHFPPLALHLILADAYAADWSMDSHKLCWFMCQCFISSFLTTSLATLDQDLSLRIEVVFPNGMRI